MIYEVGVIAAGSFNGVYAQAGFGRGRDQAWIPMQSPDFASLERTFAKIVPARRATAMSQ
jgi:hypothetical protein